MASANITSASTLPDGTREFTVTLLADNGTTILRTISVSVPAGDDLTVVRAEIKAQIIAWYKTWKATRTPLNVGSTVIATSAELG